MNSTWPRAPTRTDKAVYVAYARGWGSNDKLQLGTTLSPTNLFRVRVRLPQDGAEGRGHAEGKCDGGLARVPVNVSAQRRARFDEGAADASAVIDVRLKGDVIDHQEWRRVGTLETNP